MAQPYRQYSCCQQQGVGALTLDGVWIHLFLLQALPTPCWEPPDTRAEESVFADDRSKKRSKADGCPCNLNN